MRAGVKEPRLRPACPSALASFMPALAGAYFPHCEPVSACANGWRHLALAGHFG
jgi:hypothetical protein